ncbi:TPA: beta-glucosidase BglX [Enterococcus faecium]|uniref:beta-glucosidase BglX n=1 Tax=Enterococcus TaxID=1350 RepID=UPI00032E4072|nr:MULTISPECIES: beta-glucosidase BglX [Enterococcus]EGP5569111.1 beta-glucosidase BglX [Enterococcus faecium]EME8172098.1 beta-glucosidase BglX [Enterococcus faecium]EMF0197876.1 beta-glucosidase BglX [Enterococcus hirae]EOH38202.1 glycosyl hydrolase [Enterococcus faecium EnGen0185]EOH46529.1 glycosyl hydrolase [Enterococcus faecium EnGen0190]
MRHKQLITLIEQMTIKEKINQLLQLAAAFYSDKAEEKTGPMTQMGLNQSTIDTAGTTLGISGAKEAIRVQKTYMENHRLHIPTLLMADIIHGFRTIFPIPLALGSTWDEQAIEEMAEISAKEAAVSGLHVTFSPMIDLVRDPRWGRVMESTGEDAFLNGKLAAAMIKGYQGTNLTEDTERIAACVKHFAAYGGALGGRDYNTVDMSERQLREQYLPGYQAGLAAGAKMVMTSFNTVDGIPATGNKWLFREILREEFGFNGVVISDWGAIQELIPHGVAKDKKQAAELAIKAGVDIEMMTTCYPEYLEELINEGTISEELIDEAVLRILQLKNDLGLFENPYRGADEAKEKALVLSRTHREKAKEIARKSIVLLKNEAILPFHSQEKVAIVGPGANSQDILGAWSWQGQKQEAVSLVTGAQALETNLLIGKEVFDYFDPTEQAITEAISLAKKADKVVVALGETDWMSGEAASRSDIRLPEKQLEFFEQLTEVNPNIVVTVYSGRPLDLNGISQAKAIVQAWMPGTEGGNALAEILWGYYNPSARLSMSFPETVGQVPVFYNSDSTGRPYDSAPNEKYVSKYLDVANDPKYPFGFGLSYTQFSYSNLQVEQTWFDAQTPLKISVSVKNEGSVPGEETVQLYIRDLIGEVVRPLKELKDFKKIWLEPNEEKLVRFELTEAMVRYVHSDQKRRSEGGKFTIMVGGNSRDVLIVPAELNE